MRRLIKAFRSSYDVGEKVRFTDGNNITFYTIISSDLRDNTYTLENNGEVIERVNFTSIASEDEFVVGDKVLFKNHPYDDTMVFEVKEVLSDGTYFIESPDKAFTGINGQNLDLII